MQVHLKIIPDHLQITEDRLLMATTPNQITCALSGIIQDHINFIQARYFVILRQDCVIFEWDCVISERD